MNGGLPRDHWTTMTQLTPAEVSDVKILVACVIFFASYLVFALGKFPGLKIDRPGAAIIGAVGMVAFGIVPPGGALRFIDFPTLVLLFSMMLIVGTLHLVGFFEWNAEMVLRSLKPSRLLPAVVFTSGVLSALFVNDIVCLVMVPFVLNITRKLGFKPLPYLLAVATASNIGSVASITGNPQNMLIGSFSSISYRDFLLHLGPVAVIGLLLDWLVLHWIHMRNQQPTAEMKETIPLPPLDVSRLTKPVIVVTAVVIAFFAGVPPAMAAALGAAALLISRTLEPRKLYEEVDWGLLVFLCRTVLNRGRSRKCRHCARVLQHRRALEPAQPRCVYSCRLDPEQRCQQRTGGDAFEIVSTGLPEPAHCLAGTGDGLNLRRQSDDHRQHRQYHRGRNRQAGNAHRLLGLLPRRLPNNHNDLARGLGVAEMDLIETVDSATFGGAGLLLPRIVAGRRSARGKLLTDRRSDSRHTSPFPLLTLTDCCAGNAERAKSANFLEGGQDYCLALLV